MDDWDEMFKADQEVELGPGRLHDRYVAPFYLEMSGTSARRGGLRLAPHIVAASRNATPCEVRTLLRAHWRPRVMGAWLAVRQCATEVTAQVLTDMRNSQGYLDAPPLAVAAVTLAGLDSLTSLEIYHEKDVLCSYGAAGFIAAAVEYLAEHEDITPSVPAPSAGDRRDFASLLAIADYLRTH